MVSCIEWQIYIYHEKNFDSSWNVPPNVFFLLKDVSGFHKLLYTRTYVRQKLVVVQKYFLTSTLSYA